MNGKKFELLGGDSIHVVKIVAGLIASEGLDGMGMGLFAIDDRNPREILVCPLQSPEHVLAMIRTIMECATTHFGEEAISKTFGGLGGDSGSDVAPEDLPPEKRPN